MLLLIHFLTIAVAALALECPPKDKVYPCSCAEEFGVIMINCEGFHNVTEFEPVVKNTIGYNVSFGIYRSNIVDIPSDFFKGHTSIRLTIQQCVIWSYGDKPFSGLEDSLESLVIYTGLDKTITNLQKFKLNHLKKLKYVTFAYNDIGELGNHWFEDGPVSLQQVNLDGNQIEKVGEKVLASLVNLQQVYVNNNKIKAVARSMLPNPINHLWVLEVKSNEIEELPSDAFEGCPSLKIVNFSNNKLKSIPKNAWGKIWSQLDSLELSGNEIVCDENLKWIYSQKLPKVFEGKCAPGNDLQGRDFKSLKLEDFK